MVLANATELEEDVKEKQNITFSGGATANYVELLTLVILVEKYVVLVVLTYMVTLEPL